MKNHLTYHEKFSLEEFEQQYNLRQGRPDFEQTVVSGWLNDSVAARQSLCCNLDVRYAPGEKQKLDIFTCGDPKAATLLYIHGGYWFSGDKSLYSFIATPFVAAGVNVVIVGYDLCPDVTLTRISEAHREAVAWVYFNADALRVNRDRISIMGHSAGGHLTEMMMGTDWSAYHSDLPKNLVKAGIPISPLSLLDPVRQTASLNANIRMDQAEAESQSPMLNHHPVTDAPQLIVVGGVETDEFHRQSQMYYDTFKTRDRAMELYHVPGVDHFDEINVLVDSESPLFGKVLALISWYEPVF